MAKSAREYPVQAVLELAVVAQRINNTYRKETEAVVTDDNVVVDWKHTNKSLVLYGLGENTWQSHIPLPRLTVTDEDVSRTTEIREFYRRLAFSVIANSAGEFHKEIFSLLNTHSMPVNKVGYVASLPHSYTRDLKQNAARKSVKKCEDKILAQIDDKLIDKDCEILEVKYSDKYECWSTLAIIDDCLVSWMGKVQLTPGPCVIVKANVKGHGLHWLHKIAETRLNYVKAFQ